MVNELKQEDFENITATSEKPILIDFWASWCGPCMMQSPIIDELAEKLGDKVDFYKVNVDENEELAVKLQIGSIPTLLLYVGGAMKEKKIGLSSSADLSEMLIKYL